MLTWLMEPLGFEFMRNAIAIGVLIGILSAVIGSYLIVQHMGLLGDVIAHAVLPGLAIAFYIGVDIFLGAFLAGTISTFVVAWIQAHSKVKIDTAMALVFSGFLALGVMLITVLKSKLDLHSFLFGDILGVTSADLWRTLIITIVVLSCVAIFYRELIFYCFDPLAAKAMGLPVHFIHFGLMAGITLTNYRQYAICWCGASSFAAHGSRRDSIFIGKRTPSYDGFRGSNWCDRKREWNVCQLLSKCAIWQCDRADYFRIFLAGAIV